MMTDGFVVYRRPPYERLAMCIGEVLYPMIKVDQRDIPRSHPEKELCAYPVFWCELGPDWIQIYPRPHRDVEIVEGK